MEYDQSEQTHKYMINYINICIKDNKKLLVYTGHGSWFLGSSDLDPQGT